MTRRTGSALLLGVVIVVITLNLRAALASIGPVLPEIQAGLGLSAAEAAAVGSLGVVCLGAVAPLAPWAIRRWGLDTVLAGALAALVAGLVLRIGGGLAVLYAGTAVACGAIAFANVVLPALLKRDLPVGSGIVLGLYTTALSVSAAVAAGATAPLMRLLDVGWRGGLALWALPALLALLLWLPYARTRRREPAVPPAGGGSLWLDARAWQVTTFFALLSLSFYSLLVWLPSVLRDAGHSPAYAGLLLSVSILTQAPSALLVPRLAEVARDQRWHAAAGTGLSAAGLLGVLVAPTTVPVLWMVLIGVGQGACASLAFTLLLLRTRTSDRTAQLSSMMHAVGFLIAAAGPLLLGTARDAAGSWTPPLVLLLALLGVQLVTGVLAGRAGHVADAGVAPPRPAAP